MLREMPTCMGIDNTNTRIVRLRLKTKGINSRET
jgi:hypothetical protein